MDTSDDDDDNYNHHYGDDFDYTTVHNAQYTSAQSYNSAGSSVIASVNASVNASVSGSKQYKHIVEAHDTDMLPSAYDELLKCPGYLNRTANSVSCLAKVDSAAQKCGLRYATQPAIDDL